MKEQKGATGQLEDQHKESTYALLIRSEEKSRNVIEMAICPILILGAVIAIWQLRSNRSIFRQLDSTQEAASLASTTFGQCVKCDIRKSKDREK